MGAIDAGMSLSAIPQTAAPFTDFQKYSQIHHHQVLQSKAGRCGTGRPVRA